MSNKCFVFSSRLERYKNQTRAKQVAFTTNARDYNSGADESKQNPYVSNPTHVYAFFCPPPPSLQILQDMPIKPKNQNLPSDVSYLASGYSVNSIAYSTLSNRPPKIEATCWKNEAASPAMVPSLEASLFSTDSAAPSRRPPAPLRRLQAC